MLNPELPDDTRGSAQNECTCSFCERRIEGHPIRKKPFGITLRTPGGLIAMAPTMAMVWEFCSEECYQRMWETWLDQ